LLLSGSESTHPIENGVALEGRGARWELGNHNTDDLGARHDRDGHVLHLINVDFCSVVGRLESPNSAMKGRTLDGERIEDGVVDLNRASVAIAQREREGSNVLLGREVHLRGESHIGTQFCRKCPNLNKS